MAVAAIDSNILISYKDTSSPRLHDVAEGIIVAIDQGELPRVRVTDTVLLETLNWIHERARHDIAIDLRQRLDASAGFEVVHTAQKDFHRAVEIFEIHDTLAFGDAILTAYMERKGIEYLYSFDGDFDGVEVVTRLQSAENPFR